MPVNYEHFEHVDDSDEDDADHAGQGPSETLAEEVMQQRRKKQSSISSWLRDVIAGLERDEQEGKRPYQGPNAQTPFRRVTKEERDALAMFIVVCHPGERETSLSRYPQITLFVRDHRWLEEDPGTLELLCRVHLKVQNSKELADQSEPKQMSAMVLSAINTLAAKQSIENASTLVEVFAQICTPTTDEQVEWRRRWEKRDFAKEALLSSMFPDLAQYRKNKLPSEEPITNWEIALYVGMAVVAIIIFGVVIWLMVSIRASTNARAAGRRAKHVSSADPLANADLGAPPASQPALFPDGGEL